jgi:hypothetical protein
VPPPNEGRDARRRRLSVSLEQATMKMEATRLGVMKTLHNDEGAPPEGETRRQRTRRLSLSLEKASEEMATAQRQLAVAEALLAAEGMDSIGYRGFVHSIMDLIEAQLRPAWEEAEVPATFSLPAAPTVLCCLYCDGMSQSAVHQHSDTTPPDARRVRHRTT